MFNERLIPWFGTGTADALFLKKQANVCWASGFMGKDSCVLMTPDGGFLFTDPRYTEQAGIEAPDFTLVNWRAVGGSMMKALAHVIKEQKIGSVGFEADTLSFGEYSELQVGPHGECGGGASEHQDAGGDRIPAGILRDRLPGLRPDSRRYPGGRHREGAGRPVKLLHGI